MKIKPDQRKSMFFVLIALLLLDYLIFGASAETKKPGAADMIAAVRHGDLAKVKSFLKTYPSLAHAKDARDCTVLHFASNGNNIPIAKLLLAKGAKTGVKDVDGDTPMQWAVYAGHLETVKFLAANGADMNVPNKQDKTTLDIALDRRNKKILKFLVKNGVHIPNKGKKGGHMLHKAAAMGLTDLTAKLTAKGVSPDSTGPLGETMLHSAASGGLMDIIKEQIKKGVALESRDLHGDTPIHYAAMGGNIEALRFFLDKGIHRDIINFHGSTPLSHAVENGHLELVKLLLEKGANPALKDQWHHQALHRAVHGQGNKEIIALLLSRGADVNAVNTTGETPLFQARNKETAALLLEKGAKIKRFNVFGQTPLHWFARTGRREITQLLIDRVKTADLRDEFKRTPLHYASAGRGTGMVSFLLDKGADINARDDDGKSPLQWALNAGKKNIAKLLKSRGATLPLERTPKRKITAAKTLLSKELKPGQAYVWYLGHAGYAVKTKNRLLIFDYWQRGLSQDLFSLIHGYIDPKEIKDLDVYVFVTHGHMDHFDRTILDWQKTVKSINYVFGWQAFEQPRDNFHYLKGTRAEKEIKGVKISTINCHHDSVPEVAFLVNTDGLTIFHSGDYTGTLNSYKKDIDWFSSKYEGVDIVFTFLVGNTSTYTIQKLAPKLMFPMHAFGMEQLYKASIRNWNRLKTGAKGLYPRKRGDWFFVNSGQ